MTRPLLAESAFQPAIHQHLAMVFVPGTLVGGADDLRRLIDSGELQPLRPA